MSDHSRAAAVASSAAAFSAEILSVSEKLLRRRHCLSWLPPHRRRRHARGAATADL